MARPMKGLWRRNLPPEPPDDNLTRATTCYDPAFDSPAPEGMQQLVLSSLRLVNPRAGLVDEVPEMPPPFTGKRLLMKAQSSELGMNGKRTAAIHYCWPHRGGGAARGTRNLSLIDDFFERLLGYVPKPGSFPLEEMIGLNFMSTVVRYRSLITYRGETNFHPVARWHVNDCEFGPGARPLYDDWPRWTPLYTLHEQRRIFVPEELRKAKL